MCSSHSAIAGTTATPVKHLVRRKKLGGLCLPSNNTLGLRENALEKCRGLADLPRELLSNLVECLPSKPDLLNLRAASNRAIRDGIDFVYVKRFFEVRRCELEPANFLRHAQIAHSRLASKVRILEIVLYYKYPDALGMAPADVASASKGPCTKTYECMSHLYSTFLSTFDNMSSLKAVVIRAPVGTAATIRDVQNVFQQEADMDMSHGPFPLYVTPLAHWHIHSMFTPRSVFHAIFAAMARSHIVLERLDIVGFTISPWTGEFAPTSPLLNTIARLPNLQALVSVIFDIDMYLMDAYRTISYLVYILERNLNLKNLDLFLKPTCEAAREQQETVGRQVIECLARSSFRLRTLKLVGLLANGPITIDQIFKTHAETLRCLTLEHTHLRFPNKNHSFWKTLLNLDLVYFALRYFWYNSKNMLSSGSLTERIRGDADLNWLDLNKDQSYMDWVMVIWITHADEWIIWSFGDYEDGKVLLREKFEEVMVMINCGAIRPQ